MHAFDERGDRSRLAFWAERSPIAKRDKAALLKCFADAPVDAADVVVAIGGHSHMLQSMHRFAFTGLPLFGMNSPTAGFLIGHRTVHEPNFFALTTDPTELAVERPEHAGTQIDADHLLDAFASDERGEERTVTTAQVENRPRPHGIQHLAYCPHTLAVKVARPAHRCAPYPASSPRSGCPGSRYCAMACCARYALAGWSINSRFGSQSITRSHPRHRS